MPGTHYDHELENLAKTYVAALTADVHDLKIAIAGAAAASVIGVGSGGSFTVASLLCNLHEAYTGRVSRPSTPLELICNPTLAAASPVFFISAEGKNPDIVEALQRARHHSSRRVHVVTNRASSPLLDCTRKLTEVTPHIFDLSEKDGYLATNSLLLDAVVVARAYEELDRDRRKLPESIESFQLHGATVAQWSAGVAAFAEKVAQCGNVIVVFSPLLRSIAADLESKLSEAALVHCQVADIRSFAHGRHLWLAERPTECTVLALVEPTLFGLWEATAKLLPENVPVHALALGGAKPRDLIAGLLAEMHLVSNIARALGRDPGRPEVPQFGRDLHYIDLEPLIPPPSPSTDLGETTKYEVLGARWPSIGRGSVMTRARQSFMSSLENQAFRAVIFDYDGTLSNSQRQDVPPAQGVADELTRLLEHGVHVGIATGRGDSVQDCLKSALPERHWGAVRVGLYNCGHISDLTSTPATGETSEFLSHVTRIVGRLKALGMPIQRIRPTYPHQVSVRFFDGIEAESNWFAIADALRQAGLNVSRVVYSKHSVDILGSGVDKSHLVADFIQQYKIEPLQILTVGDQGAWPGNDAALLEHRFSLSVDVPSRRIDRGWKLAPRHKRHVDATLWYLRRMKLVENESFCLELEGDQ